MLNLCYLHEVAYSHDFSLRENFEAFTLIWLGQVEEVKRKLNLFPYNWPLGKFMKKIEEENKCLFLVSKSLKRFHLVLKGKRWDNHESFEKWGWKRWSSSLMVFWDHKEIFSYSSEFKVNLIYSVAKKFSYWSSLKSRDSWLLTYLN